MAEDIDPGKEPTPPADSAAADASVDDALKDAQMLDADVAPDGAEVDSLLSSAAADAATPGPTGAGDEQSAVDELLAGSQFDDPAAANAGSVVGEPPAEGFQLRDLEQAISDAQVSSIDLLRDVELNVKIELGRSRMLVEEVLKLAEGSVVELDKLAGDPVDVFVNDRLVARGEVLVLNENFCVRVNEIVSGSREDLL